LSSFYDRLHAILIKLVSYDCNERFRFINRGHLLLFPAFGDIVKCLVRTYEKEIIVLFGVYEEMEKRKRELEELYIEK
jgi:hypothetical protein